MSVTTERYDNARTGANLSETTLNTSNVNSTQFGKLYSYSVDGSIYAQPLYVPNVAIPGLGTHNVLYVVTMNDVVYAFDADSNAVNGGVLWSVDLRNPSAGVTPIPITDVVGHNDGNIVGNVGIESTPVIDISGDATTNTMYLVARTKEVSGNQTNYVARLHALDITTGAEKFGGPVLIDASVPLVFDPLHQNQRSSLALVNGMILFSWASHEDLNVWYGWIMAYNAKTLAQVGAFCTTPSDSEGGVWMSGRAPAVDSSGNVYYASGNGGWDGVSNFSDSVLKFSTTGNALSLKDYFTPDDYADLDTGDLDLGSSGPMLIPGTNLVVHGGKTSVFYLMNTSNLGHEQSGNGQIVQNFATGGNTGTDIEIHSGPVFWNRTSGAGPTMYVWPNSMSMLSYQFTGSTFNTTPISQSSIVAPSGDSGGVLTLSANGSTAGTGIVWASIPLNQDADVGTVQGVLRAFDANNLTTELWDSTMNDSRDDMGIWPKYSPPTVVNGKVYMASFSGVLNVYGVLPVDFSISVSPSTQIVIPGGSTTYTVSTSSMAGFAGSVSLSASGLPTGATWSFSPTTIGAPGSSTLTVTAASSTPVGTYTLTITGSSGTLSHNVTAVLIVQSSAGTPIPQSGWSLLSVDSQEITCGSYGAVNSFDGNPATFWHTQWCPNVATLPHDIQINLGATYNVTGFTMLPRQDGCSNGWISQYQFYVSTDGVNWGSPVSSGTFNYGTGAKFGCSGASVPSAIQVLFPTVTGRYIQLVAQSEVNGNQLTSLAEINVLASSTAPIPVLTSLTVNPASVVGGNPSQGTVTISSAAPASGITVTLTSSNTAAATVPASATIGSGATSATFPITTFSVTTSTSSTITASYAGVTETASQGVAAAAVVTSVTLNPTTVVGGNPSQGTVTLSAAAPATGAVVTLGSSNTAAATVPASVTVASGATTATFTVTTVSVSTTTSSVISATYGGTQTATLGVQAASTTIPIPQSGWSLLSVDSQETSCGSYGAVNSFDGNPATFWHTQWCPNVAPLPHDIQINLGAAYNITGFTYLPRQDGCSNGWISQYQFFVSTDGVNWGTAVANGTFNYGTGAKFGCPGASVPSAIQVLFPTVTGRYIQLIAQSEVNGNQITSMAEINVLASSTAPIPVLTSLTVNPTSVVGGNPSQGTVTISSAAPASGITVTLTSSNTAAATVPVSVTIGSGATSATFPITTFSVTTSTSSTITASYAGVTETASQGVAAAAVVTSVTLNPTSVVGGNPSQGTVTLSAAAPATGAVVTLGSSNTAAATVPASVTVASGATTATFTITTVSVSTTTSSVISATYGGTQTATLAVQASSGTTPIPQSGWSLLAVDSQETSCGSYGAVKSFDGNPSTFWHTKYCPSAAALPHHIDINLGATYTVTGFTMLPRQDGCSNGWISQYQFFVSTDGVNWGTAVASGTFNYGSASMGCPGASAAPAIQVLFPGVSAKYVRLVALTEVSGKAYTSVAEINVLH